MRLILEVISGPFQGKQIEVKVGDVISVGRTPKSNVALEDTFLSGKHFAVECDVNGCRLRDLNSRNGTTLNGEMITEAPLNHGDQVHAGHTDFSVRIEYSADGAMVAEPAAPLPTPPEFAPGEEKPPSSRKRSPTGPVSSVLAPPSERVADEPLSRSSKEPLPAPDVAGAHGDPKVSAGIESAPARPKTRRRSGTALDHARHIENEPATPIQSKPQAAPSAAVIPAAALDSYEAATPDGRLLHILSSQPQTLMALIDATRDARVLELLRSARAESQSLYRSEQTAAIAPYLVRLTPRSELLKQMIQKGWGHEWGVYLTCPLPLTELCEYFRTSLMITMPDGMELFSRFYDPAFFRVFLETCTAPEAEKFFGPVTSYFMEDKRPEILLEFVRNNTGTEKRGHLLSVLT